MGLYLHLFLEIFGELYQPVLLGKQIDTPTKRRTAILACENGSNERLFETSQGCA